MNHYITGKTIKKLREQKNLTQLQLALQLDVSDKTISKWETAKGLPDITLLEPLAKALGISVAELLSGEDVVNRNKASNLLRSSFYVCPICANNIHAMGETVISCCGITLPALEVEPIDAPHAVNITQSDDELFVELTHEMKKEHYISFVSYLSYDSCQLVKLYPEGDAGARFAMRGNGLLYYYCNKHGLFSTPIRRHG